MMVDGVEDILDSIPMVLYVIAIELSYRNIRYSLHDHLSEENIAGYFIFISMNLFMMYRKNTTVTCRSLLYELV
jgi:hypothetical protein